MAKRTDHHEDAASALSARPTPLIKVAGLCQLTEIELLMVVAEEKPRLLCLSDILKLETVARIVDAGLRFGERPQGAFLVITDHDDPRRLSHPGATMSARRFESLEQREGEETARWEAGLGLAAAIGLRQTLGEDVASGVQLRIGDLWLLPEDVARLVTIASIGDTRKHQGTQPSDIEAARAKVKLRWHQEAIDRVNLLIPTNRALYVPGGKHCVSSLAAEIAADPKDRKKKRTMRDGKLPIRGEDGSVLAPRSVSNFLGSVRVLLMK